LLWFGSLPFAVVGSLPLPLLCCAFFAFFGPFCAQGSHAVASRPRLGPAFGRPDPAPWPLGPAFGRPNPAPWPLGPGVGMVSGGLICAIRRTASLCSACAYLRRSRAIRCDIGFALFSCRLAVIRSGLSAGRP